MVPKRNSLGVVPGISVAQKESTVVAKLAISLPQCHQNKRDGLKKVRIAVYRSETVCNPTFSAASQYLGSAEPQVSGKMHRSVPEAASFEKPADWRHELRPAPRQLENAYEQIRSSPFVRQSPLPKVNIWGVPLSRGRLNRGQGTLAALQNPHKAARRFSRKRGRSGNDVSTSPGFHFSHPHQLLMTASIRQDVKALNTPYK